MYIAEVCEGAARAECIDAQVTDLEPGMEIDRGSGRASACRSPSARALITIKLLLRF
jgi:hypothetical protein